MHLIPPVPGPPAGAFRLLGRLVLLGLLLPLAFSACENPGPFAAQNGELRLALGGRPAGMPGFTAWVRGPEGNELTREIRIGETARFSNLGVGFQLQAGIVPPAGGRCEQTLTTFQTATFEVGGDEPTDHRVEYTCRAATLIVAASGLDSHQEARVRVETATDSVLALRGEERDTLDLVPRRHRLSGEELSFGREAELEVDLALGDTAVATLAFEPVLMRLSADPPNLTLRPGDTATVHALGRPSGSRDPQPWGASWESLDTTLVRTLPAGSPTAEGRYTRARVTAVAPGTTGVRLTAPAPGVTAEANVPVVVLPPPVDEPPTVTLTSPTDGATFAYDDDVELRGSATDPEDGALPDGALVWSSTLDGGLGTGGALDRILSPGLHTVTLSATDAAGNSASASVQVTVTAPNQPPTVSILAPQDGATFPETDEIGFQASATDAEDGPLTGASLVWSSDLAGAVGMGESISTTLPAGTQTVSVVATDADGAADTASIAVTVTPVTGPGSISGRVTANGNSMGDVGVELTGDATASTATDNDGRYEFPGLAPGTYTVTIDPFFANVSFPALSVTVTLAPGQDLVVDFPGTY